MIGDNRHLRIEEKHEKYWENGNGELQTKAWIYFYSPILSLNKVKIFKKLEKKATIFGKYD